MIVDSALYVDGQRTEGRLALEDVPAACRRPGAFVWLGLYEPANEEFEAVRTAFGLHELAVEDAVKARQRPKLEVYDDSLFLVLKTARYLDAEERVEFGEILVFVGSNFIVHVRHGEATALTPVRQRIEARPDLLSCGPGAVLHAIVDHVVDNYAPVIAGLENDIGEVELEVFSERGHNPVQRIYMLKREVLELYQAATPLEEALDALHLRKFEPIHEDIREYFRDVHDHLLKVVERTNTFSDLLTSILSANLTSVTVRQNEDMRKISAWVAIAAVPTMLAGIYGMNFEHMPELGWAAGYPLALGLMATACLLLYRFFRRSGWL
ncbi:MAG TPA: magnesium/cobalt transporter CorA [Acidimicrobiia bacterium]|nr:magnesium/cobalt transporter CorA [Acidimicrobiia bacterium]